MTQTPTHPGKSRSRAATTIGLVLGVTPALGGLAFISVSLLGPLGLLVLLPAICLLLLYRAVVRSTHSDQTRTWARELGAIALALALGFGVWVGAVMVGLVLEVVPFLSEGSYPHATAWFAASAILAVLSVPGSWWLLRRWADPQLTVR